MTIVHMVVCMYLKIRKIFQQRLDYRYFSLPPSFDGCIQSSFIKFPYMHLEVANVLSVIESS